MKKEVEVEPNQRENEILREAMENVSRILFDKLTGKEESVRMEGSIKNGSRTRELVFTLEAKGTGIEKMN